MDDWRQKAARWGGFRCRVCDQARSNEYRTRDLPRYVWRNARDRARTLGIPFSLTVDDIRKAWPEDGRCPVFGFKLVRKRGGSGASPSLDRMNNRIGYKRGNIAIISMKANRAKGASSAAELERLLRWMKKQGLR